MSSSSQWSGYLDNAHYTFSTPIDVTYNVPEVGNRNGGALGQPGHAMDVVASTPTDEMEPAMLMSRPPSSMDGISSQFGLPVNPAINAQPSSPTDTRGPSPIGHSFATPAPQGLPRSTLQDLLTDTGGVRSNRIHDVFSRTPAPGELFRGGGSQMQFLDKYCAAMSLDATSRKQLQRLLEVRRYFIIEIYTPSILFSSLRTNDP